MDYKDYYAVMGVARDATQDEIKRAYRKLARKYHPDVSKEPDAEARFKELGEAYEVLRDAEKRAAYDQLGSNWRAGQDFRPPPNWDSNFEFSGGGFGGQEHGSFSDFFESLFGRGAQFHSGGFSTSGHSNRAGRGEDHHARIAIGVEEAFHGGTVGLQLKIPAYDAQGRLVDQLRTLQVKIPRGVVAGKRIRLAGQGGAGYNGGPAGDLFLEIAFNPHPLYEVQGKDVYLTLPVTPWEAALGGKLKAPTLGGMVDLNVPAGAKSGQKLRLKGRGIPDPKEAPGDQYVVLQIVTPPADSEANRALYQRMAEEMPFNPRAHLGA